MGSVTHNLDMDQRFIPLAKTVQAGGVRVDGPANANVAPPGYYMVFLVDTNGVPSVGKIVKVEKAADTRRADGARLADRHGSDGRQRAARTGRPPRTRRA